MPSCDAEYLLNYLFGYGQIGISMPAGMGESSITHCEIEKWQRNTGIILSAWESTTLKGLSSEYVSESYSAKDPDSESAWKECPYPNINKIISSIRLRNSLRVIEKK